MDIFLGFDFGTYSTKVAFYKGSGEPKILGVAPFSDRDGIIYSFLDEKSGKIGKEAYEAYKRGEGSISYGFKMELDTESGFKKAKEFLNKVYNRTLEILNEKGYRVKRVRFSAPNSWVTERNEQFLKLLQDIGVVKNYKEEEQILISEPLAAAKYHLHGELEKAGKKALIIDAGAGTIDVLVINTGEDGTPEEVSGSYGTLIKAGRYVDEIIKEFYNLHTLREAEELKFSVSRAFRRGETKLTRNDIYVSKSEFEKKCLKDWIEDFKNFLSKYKKYNPDYLILTGGFSAFYLIENIAKEMFPKAKPYPKIKKEAIIFDRNTEFRKDISISFGCSILAFDRKILRETLKFDIYLQIESIGIKKATYKGKNLEVIPKGRGVYLIRIFEKDDYVGNEVSLKDVKIDGKPFGIKQFGTIEIVQKYPHNMEYVIELPIEKFRGEPMSNIIFEVDYNKIIKLNYIYEDGRVETISQCELKDLHKDGENES